jgi:hypothetical protein
MIRTTEQHLAHYGILRRSGRYLSLGIGWYTK